MGFFEENLSNSPPSNADRGHAGPRRWRVARDEALKADRQAGKSIEELATAYDLSIASVYQITRGVPRPPKKREYRTQFHERNVAIVAAYERGEMNATELGEKYGLTRERVCQILRPTNVIAKAAERRRIAQEEAQSASVSAKAALRADREQKISQGIGMVRAGMSIAAATVHLGLPANVLLLACKMAGIASQHGRWRSLQPKIDLIRKLRSEGLSFSEISRRSVAAGYGQVYAGFIQRNCPELYTPHTSRRGETSGSVPTTVPTAIHRRSQDSVWTDDKVAILVAAWANGSTASQCAEMLGPPFTRNAVIGKINRLREGTKPTGATE